MAAQPEVIRSQIESTREDLAYDIDRLADRTSPRRIVRRRWDSMRSRVADVRERVMGTSEDAMDRVRDTSQDAMEGVRGAPEAVARKTRGNPLAAGLIAFGAGLLAASLLPETEAERRAAHEISDRAGELVEPLRESGQQLASGLGDSVREAAGEVQQSAKESAAAVRESASSS